MGVHVKIALWEARGGSRRCHSTMYHFTCAGWLKQTFAPQSKGPNKSQIVNGDERTMQFERSDDLIQNRFLTPPFSSPKSCNALPGLEALLKTTRNQVDGWGCPRHSTTFMRAVRERDNQESRKVFPTPRHLLRASDSSVN